LAETPLLGQCEATGTVQPFAATGALYPTAGAAAGGALGIPATDFEKLLAIVVQSINGVIYRVGLVLVVPAV
jgi:hypothetical protein